MRVVRQAVPEGAEHVILGARAFTPLFGGPWQAYRDGKPCPASDLHVNSNSIDVTLGDTLLVPLSDGMEGFSVDLRVEDSVYWADMDTQGFALAPRMFALGCTRERFDCRAAISGNRTFAPMYEGRSTLARMGLMSHLSAGFGDWGFQGSFTLELYNCFPRPLLLFPGMRIGQVYFVEVEDPAPYTGAYSGTDHYDKPRPPRLGEGRV
jgi:dCTP deaminase